jgi:hypothetical protein
VKALRDPLLWLVALFVALLFLMPHSAALFSALSRAAAAGVSAGELY